MQYHRHEAAVESRMVATGETNPLADFGGPDYFKQIDRSAGRVRLSDPQLKRIERLRLLGGFPWWDVSYCTGRLTDGRLVEIDLGTDRIERRYKAHLVKLCKNAGRYGKALGIFEAVSTLAG